MQLKPILTLSALLLAGAAHADTAAPPDATPRYVQYVLNDTLLPRYQQLADANRALASQLQQSCARPDNAGLAAVRQQWQQAYGSWMRVAALNWGPTAQLRSQRTIAFKPTRTALVDSAVSRSAAHEADVFDTTGTAAKGYTAIEYLLYRPSASLATPGVCAWLQRNADDLTALLHACGVIRDGERRAIATPEAVVRHMTGLTVVQGEVRGAGIDRERTAIRAGIVGQPVHGLVQQLGGRAAKHGEGGWVDEGHSTV